MLTFIIANIFLLSLTAILFMVARALPRIEAPEEPVTQNAFERWVTSGVPERLDAFTNAFLAKLLRKSKVFILKIDNIVTTKLQGFAKEGKVKPDFKDVMGEKKEDEQTPV